MRSWVVLGSVMISAAFALACNDAPDDEVEGASEQDVTTAGTASVGQHCLVKPILRSEKCKPGLVCNEGATPGTCHEVSAEAGPCDVAFGNANCQPGLVCTAVPGAAAGPSSGFCKGAGTTVCRPVNAGLDCASGYVCDGTRCVIGGEAGTPCSMDLVENECAVGFECIAAPGAKTGVCKSQGDLGTTCVDDHACQGNLVCAGNQCAARRPAGSGCSRDAMCMSGLYCDTTRPLPFCTPFAEANDVCGQGGRRCGRGLECRRLFSGGYGWRCVKP